MRRAANQLQDVRRRLLAVQVLLTVVTAVVFALARGWPAGAAALYGGAVATGVSWWLGWRVGRAVRAGQDGSVIRIALYVGVFQRLVFVIAAFAFGLGVLKLAPAPLVVAFAVAQFGYLAGAWRA